MSFPAYPGYKDSGIAWLGNVPSHWAVSPVKTVATFNDEVLTEAADPELEIDYIEISDVDEVVGIKGTSTLAFGDAPSRARRIARAGDILVSTVRTYLRAIAPLPTDLDGAIASTGFCVIRGHSADSDFLSYAMRSEAFVAEVISRSVGVSYPAINASDLVAIHIPIPSLAEQATIAAFLDRETAKIDALVAEQERLIALLREKRQAVISHAVTKGLNPDAPLKDSGIEWLGEIPAHWVAGRIKHVCSVKGRIGFRGYTTEDLVAEGEGALALGGANMGDNGKLSLDKRTFLSWDKFEESPEIMVFRGDILIGQRGSCGSAVLVDTDLGPTTINPSLVVLKNLQIDSRFLTYSVNSAPVQSVVASILSKTAVPMLSQEQIGNMPITLPPEAEQEAISEQLDDLCGAFDRLVNEAQSAITLLQERRAALISAAVTGKIDVRGVVPQSNVVSIESARPSNLPPLRAVVGAYAIRELGPMGRMAVMKAGYLAEGHTGFGDLNGRYERYAAGPYDQSLISAMERGAGEICAIATNEPQDEGRPVTYDVPKGCQPPSDALSALVGEDRAQRFLALLSLLKGIGRDGVEAAATLYAVWNDLLAAGKTADDDAICNGVLNDWHPEKAKKFKRADLDHWLDWMRRNDLVPDGSAPRTDNQGNLFA